MKNSKIVTLPALIILLLAGALTGLLIFGKPKSTTENINQPLKAPEKQDISQQLPVSSPTPTPSPSVAGSVSLPLPKVFQLSVPFSAQAPTANWDELHNEACEETSAIMAAAYYNNNHNSTLAADFVESELSKITEWEKQTFGYYLDIDTNETAKLLTDFYGLNAQVVNNMTEEEIKKQLKDGRVIIWPANGRKLGNPNFRQPGPPYHMLVIKGWDSQGFITNDPGTRKGHNYPYTYEVLYNANGTWSHNLNAVDEGNKTAIVVWSR